MIAVAIAGGLAGAFGDGPLSSASAVSADRRASSSSAKRCRQRVRDGRMVEYVASKERVNQEDILSAARCLHGIENMEEIKHAVLEAGGKVSIILRGPAR